jgi:hypothetical protein
MDVLFVQGLEPNFRPHRLDEEKCLLSRTRVIALTPAVIYSFENWKVEYRIPEDYLFWEETKEHREYVLGFLDRLNSYLLDNYTSNFLRELRIPITYYCATMWKNILDPLARIWSQFEAIVKEEAPQKIYYSKETFSTRDIIDHELYFKGEHLWSRVFRYYPANKKQYEPIPIFSGYQNSRREGLQHRIKGIYYLFSGLRFLPFWKRKRILFADSTPHLIREAKRQGYRVSVLSSKPVEPLPLSAPVPGRTIRWIVDKLVWEELLVSRISYFVNIIVPLILRYASKYEVQFRTGKYSCIVFTRRNQLYQYGALIAANRVGLPAVYVRHGWDAYDIWIRQWTRFAPFDYYVCPVEEDKKFYYSKIQEWEEKCIVL